MKTDINKEKDTHTHTHFKKNKQWQRVEPIRSAPLARIATKRKLTR